MENHEMPALQMPIEEHTHYAIAKWARGLDNIPDSSDSLTKQKTIEAPQAILTLGKHGSRTAEMVCANQL
jgi:hypothetical protein